MAASLIWNTVDLTGSIKCLSLKMPPVCCPPQSAVIALQCFHNSETLTIYPVRRQLCLQGKLEFISCDGAPLVAHVVIANRLTCIISGTQSFLGTKAEQTFRTSVLPSLEMTGRQSEYKNMMARPRYNCRPFLRWDVSDWHVVNITTNKCQYVLSWHNPKRKRTINPPFAAVISLM